MKNKFLKTISVGLFKLLIPVLLVFCISFSAHALLLDRGGGLIYDTDLDVTWLQDLNYAMTSSYDTDGLMDWDQANTWATELEFGGFDNWRLPTFDPANTRPVTPTSTNEIGSLVLSLKDGDWGNMTTYNPFTNIIPVDQQWYWTGLTVSGSFPPEAWRYSLECG